MEANNINIEEFSEVLTDVRKAYRFTYIFQRRVMDLVEFIGKYYKFKYLGGYSHYSKTILKGKGKLRDSAWEFLPMYHFEFQFITPEIDNRQLIFSILCQCDTGFYDTGLSEKNKDSIDVFKSAEESETFLHLVFREINSDINHYKNYMYKTKSAKLIPNNSFQFNENELLIGQKFPLLNFFDENRTKLSLIEFDNHCSEYGIIFRSKIK